jgi:hypothetical protein
MKFLFIKKFVFYKTYHPVRLVLRRQPLYCFTRIFQQKIMNKFFFLTLIDVKIKKYAFYILHHCLSKIIKEYLVCHTCLHYSIYFVFLWACMCNYKLTEWRRKEMERRRLQWRWQVNVLHLYKARRTHTHTYAFIILPNDVMSRKKGRWRWRKKEENIQHECKLC